MKRTLLLVAATILIALPATAFADTITFTAPTTAANTPGGSSCSGPNPAASCSNNTSNTNYQGGAYQFDLDHYRAYTWQIGNVVIPPGHVITGATITFRNIANWDTNANMLFVHMLDSARSFSSAGTYGGAARSATVNGVTWYTDDSGGAIPISDYFAGADGALVAAGTSDTFLFQQAFNMVGQGGYQATNFTHTFTPAQLQALVQYLANGNNLAFGFDPDCHFWNNGIVFTITTSPNQPVPEPATLALLGSGLGGLYLKRRRRKLGTPQA